MPTITKQVDQPVRERDGAPGHRGLPLVDHNTRTPDPDQAPLGISNLGRKIDRFPTDSKGFSCPVTRTCEVTSDIRQVLTHRDDVSIKQLQDLQSFINSQRMGCTLVFGS